jgi:EpsI family protein
MRASLKKTVALVLMLLLASGLAHWFTPNAVHVLEYPRFDERLPKQLGQWQYARASLQQVSAYAAKETDLSQPYNDVVMRTYADPQGHQVMLTLAWGQRQRQEVKIHRPDLCYVAQGFKVASLQSVDLKGFEGYARPIVVHHMVAQDSRGFEAVSYWMRVGAEYSDSAFDTRLHIIKEGLQGRIPDGVLVRASVRTTSLAAAQEAFPMLDEFLHTMHQAAPAQLKPYLIR